MYQILNELNKTPGITGSMVVGNDGIVIASDLESGLEGDTVGALAASITTNIQKSLDRLRTDAGIGILVVTAEKDVNIGLIRLEIKNAVNRLRSVA
jgi:predicted regulator of Ras-like GTPase activity (Roadblock/LC7/MglB family)